MTQRRVAPAVTETNPVPWGRYRVAPRTRALSNQIGDLWVIASTDRPVAFGDPLKDLLNVRRVRGARTLLNQTPTVAPHSLTGSKTRGDWSCGFGSDPEGDRCLPLVPGPSRAAAAQLDGRFTYTTGDGFNGVDYFVVRPRWI